MLCAALRPAPGRRYLSIASAGDNSFALLASGAEVVAADLSAPQLALVELKRAALRELDYEPLLEFLGARRAEPGARLAVWARLAPALPGPARDFWSSRPDTIAAGVATRGKFEGYFRLFRRFALPLVHRRGTVLALLEPRDEAGRRDFYDRVWDGWRWRLLFHVFFSRFVMARLGRDREFFRHVEGSVGARILARARYALTALPVHVNPYVEMILTGRFRRALPPYLEPGVWEGVRAHLDRLTLHQGGIDEVAMAEVTHRGGFDGFNLSDLFEYLSVEQSAAIYERLLAAARPGARFVYWNLLVPRRAPVALAQRVRALDEEAAALFARDRAFFYQSLVIEEVVA